MELAARRFARWVLIIHLLLLVGVLLTFYFAGKHVYLSARNQAIGQAGKRQSLLAEQTAQGIAGYYQSIRDTLDLLRSTEENARPSTQPAVGAGTGANLGSALANLSQQNPRRTLEIARALIVPSLWQQLKSRASMLMIVDRASQKPLMVLPATDSDRGETIATQASAWLDSIQAPAVSPLFKVTDAKDDDVNLVCVPAVSDASRLFLVAVVPIRNIDEQFLKRVHADKAMSGILLDDHMRVITAYDKSIVGLSLLEDGSDPRIASLARQYQQAGEPGTAVIEAPFRLGAHQFNSGLISVQPVEVLGKRWWLSIGSDLADVDALVKSTLRGSMWWGIFLVVSIAAILASTAVQMIRSRIRAERTRHEILTRELSQARKIQLAWLPQNDDGLRTIDVFAVNQPASHISGDFYNWFELEDGRVCVVIGDVTGHGMAAAFLMATTQLLVRMIMPRVREPGRCLEQVNQQLCQQLFSGQFVTMQIVVIDPASGRVEFASAGHPPPLVGSSSHFTPLQVESQLVLGVEPDLSFCTETAALPRGSSIILYTDGVLDAINSAGRRFRMEGLVASLAGQSVGARDTAERITTAVDAFRADRELVDDLTLVTIRI